MEGPREGGGERTAVTDTWATWDGDGVEAEGWLWPCAAEGGFPGGHGPAAPEERAEESPPAPEAALAPSPQGTCADTAACVRAWGPHARLFLGIQLALFPLIYLLICLEQNSHINYNPFCWAEHKGAE